MLVSNEFPSVTEVTFGVRCKMQDVSDKGVQGIIIIYRCKCRDADSCPSKATNFWGVGG